MNESNITTKSLSSPLASLAAIGAHVKQYDLFGPLRSRVKIRQKTVKYTPIDKLYDAWIGLLAGVQGMVEINTRLRPDQGLQQAFGRDGCAEQSVIQDTLDACSQENVQQLQAGLDQIYRESSGGYRHDYQAGFQVLDVDMSGLPCGKKAAFATKGYFAGQRNRRGRQMGRVLASLYDEVVTDRLFAGTVQLVKALQPLIQAAETTLELDDARRAKTLIRIDSGAGTIEDLNWLLARGYHVLGKERHSQRAKRLAQSVTHWVQDAAYAERSFGWVEEPASEYIRPVERIAVRCTKQDGTFGYGVLICSLSRQHIGLLKADTGLLEAYVHLYDERGGGVETSLAEDKGGLGLSHHNKHRFEAQEMLLGLGQLAHNVIIWAKAWLAAPQLQGYGILRMVRDVFHVNGLLLFDASGRMLQVILNRRSRLAHWLLPSFQHVLAFQSLVVCLGET